MTVISATPLRSTLAALLTLSGLWQVSVLWMLELNATTLGIALCGCIYLILGLGMFGVSRFALFITAAATTARALLGWNPMPILEWEQLRLLVDVVSACCTAYLFWQSRHAPTH